MKTRLFRIAMPFIILGIVTGMLASPSPVRAVTYTVNSIDDSDSYIDSRCTAAHCTLRAAIELANTHDGPDVINFNIPGSGPYTIHLAGMLPTLRDGGTTIAGDSQPGYVNNLVYGSGLNARGTPVIVLDGGPAELIVAIAINSNGNIIRGLSLINFTGGYAACAIDVYGANNTIEKNFIGLAPDGSVQGNSDGIWLDGESQYVIDNVISGNGTGIQVREGVRHMILGNLIGTDPTGSRAAEDSRGFGIIAYGSVNSLIIGGSSPAERNVISGFSNYGEGIDADFGAVIQNNYIGTNAAGDAVIPNYIGINLAANRCDAYPDGMCRESPRAVVEGNLISGNEYGIRADTDRSIIRGNRIGTNAAGNRALGRQGYGIFSEHGRELLIGGYGRDEGNLISGNGIGISLEDEAGSADIFGNILGTDLSGATVVPNEIGLKILTPLNDIGSPEAGNLISGNGIGIWIEAESNSIRNNRIGTDAAGTAGIPNNVGIRVVGIQRELQIHDNNPIAFNTSYGIHMQDSSNMRILHNTVHSNGMDGIFLETTSSGSSVHNLFMENSIYHNGGLGIQFQSSAINDGIEPPVITAVTGTTVEGTSCPGCHIEIFLSDRDPSGFGEGQTFLTSIDAFSSGVFRADLGRTLDRCDTLTATATGAYLNTSTFSRSFSAGVCIRPPTLLVWIWIILWAAGGSVLSLVLVIARRPGSPSGFSLLVPGLAGGLLGAIIAIGLLALPVVQIDWNRGEQAPPASPSCGQFIDAATLFPEEGTIFSPGTDVLFELSPQPDPPGMQTRWFLDVTGPGNHIISKELTSNSISLSEVGFDPKQTGVYFWTLKGERSQNGSMLWTPLCTDTIQRMFQIASPHPVQPAATETVAPDATATATQTVTPTLSAPTATLRQNGICRRGPGTEYDAVTTIPNGSNVPIVGRNQNSSWWQVQVPGTQTQCWLADENVETSGDTNQVPVVEVEPFACWVKQNQGPDKCVAPCPQGAQPGGSCTP